MFVLSSISSGLESWSVNYTSIYENLNQMFLKLWNFLGEISNKWPNNLLGTNVYKTLALFLITIINNITIY